VTALTLVFVLLAAAGSPLDGICAAAAKDIAARVPAGKRVVVVKDAFLNESGVLTRLGWGLGQDLTTDLVNAGRKKKLVVVDRALGDRFTVEEFQYRVQRMSAESLLARFQADYAVVGRYEWRDNALVLTATAISIPGAEIAARKRSQANCTGNWLTQFRSEDSLPAPEFTPTILELLFDDGNWPGAVASLDIVHLPDSARNPGFVFVGDSVRLDVGLGRVPSHLYVLSYDSTNHLVSLLQPNKLQPESRVSERRVLIPSAELGAIPAIAPAGENWLKAIAANTSIGCDFCMDAPVPENDPRILAFLQTLRRKQESEGLLWGSQLRRLTIVERYE
jgi:hypothetical protein